MAPHRLGRLHGGGTDVIKVLSIDGGGIRGIMPAIILAEIERRTRRPIASLFHLIAGTSTGGLLALLLTRPTRHRTPLYTAAELVALYETEGLRIFPRSIWQQLHSVGNIVDEKYPDAGLEEVLNRYLGRARLKEALTDVLITSYEIERRIPWFFRSRRAKRRKDYDFLMKDVARAACAAPTYFEPHKLRGQASADAYALIDGGVFANNPAMCAFAEAKVRYPSAKEILVVSLGTGEHTRPLPYERVKDWGLMQWTQTLLGIVFHGISATVDYQMRQLLPARKGRGARYHRFQTRLDLAHDTVDDASPANIRGLKLMAEELIRDRQDDLTRLCAQLVRSRQRVR